MRSPRLKANNLSYQARRRQQGIAAASLTRTAVQVIRIKLWVKAENRQKKRGKTKMNVSCAE